MRIESIRDKKFTLIELLVVIGLIGVLLALVVPIAVKASGRSKQISCINNLREISMAVQLYYNDNRHYPAYDYLRNELAHYHTEEPAAWNCPATEEPYEIFYVPRGVGQEQDSSTEHIDNYFVGCPFHSIVNFAAGKGPFMLQPGRVTHNGEEISAGTEVSGGVLEFEDGSTVTVNGDVMVMSSFRMKDGRLYSILRVFNSYGSTTLQVTVPPNTTPKSKFEIVTPASISGVVGTEFTVQTSVTGSTVQTDVTVTRGKVVVNSPYSETVAATPNTGTVRNVAPLNNAHSRPSWAGIGRRIGWWLRWWRNLWP